MKFDKHLVPSMLVWLFTFVGILATAVNLQFDSQAADKKINNTDAAHVFLFASASNSIHLVDRNDDNYTPDISTDNAFFAIQSNWHFAGLVKSASQWALPLPNILHFQPPLRAPPLQ